MVGLLDRTLVGKITADEWPDAPRLNSVTLNRDGGPGLFRNYASAQTVAHTCEAARADASLRYAYRRRQRAPAKASNPLPRRNTVPGSGIVAG